MAKNNRTTDLDDDLFFEWEQELALRHQLRTSSAKDLSITIGSETELELLWRALYFSGQKDIFWSIIINQLQLSSVLNWLAADDNRLDEFLAYLPVYFTNKKPEPKKLQYLIHLFADKFYDRFRAIAAILDAPACSYLISRSANPQFRRLINQRLRFLQEQKCVFFYGLDEQMINSAIPTLHGDKIKMLATGLELLQIDMQINSPRENPFQLKREAAEAFYRAGMITDSLALLISASQFPEAELSETMNSTKNKQFAQLLRKVTASYCLIYQPMAAGFNYSKIYRDYFPFYEPDQATLKYFAVYDLLKMCRQSGSIYPLYQIAYEAELIAADRNNDYLLVSQEDLENGLSEPRTIELKTLIEQTIFSLPHEAFITMQVMYLLMEKNLADPSRLADFLLNQSLLLFNWVPSQLFIETSFLTDFAPFIKDETREEAERILAEIEAFNSTNESAEAQKLKWSKSKDTVRLRQIIAGKFLGVL